MKNSEEQYPEIKRNDYGFSGVENKFKEPSLDQDPDCWSELWQRIRDQGSRFLK